MISSFKLRILGFAALNYRIHLHALLLFLLLSSIQLNSCKAEQPKSDKSMYSSGIIDSKYEQKSLVFERKLIELSKRLKIPSVSVAVVKSGEIVFARGYGYSSLESKTPTTENTLYHIASITKTFTASIILNLADAGKLNIDDFANKYEINLPAGVTIRHLMSHTSNFEPGSVFYYNSTRFSLLGNIIEKVTGKAFAKILSEMVLERLGMSSTHPNPASKIFSFNNSKKSEVFNNLSKPYKIENGKPVLSQYPTGFSPGAGLVSNVIDLAKYASALEDNRLFGSKYAETAYNPFVTEKGDTLPYGLGWFVQFAGGKRIVWHYGDWKCNSSLLMRIPVDSLTLILLANTDGLSAPFMGLGLPGDITYSPFADAFLRIFVFNDFDDSFINEYSRNPNAGIISKYSESNNLIDLVKRIIATAEIEMEVAKDSDYIKLLKPLYQSFKVTDLKNYTGRFSTKSFDIKIKSEKGILKAVFVKKNQNKKKSSAGEDTEEYFISPERENLFYMNTYMKIRFIIGPNGKAKSLELMKLGETEYGRRR